MKQLLVMSGMMLLVSGCATLGTAQAARGNGAFAIYTTEKAKVFQVTQEVMQNLGLTIVATNEGTGTILAETPMTLMSYGESVAVWVTEINPTHTRVEVVSKRKLATNLFAYNWEGRILTGLRYRLGTSS